MTRSAAEVLRNARLAWPKLGVLITESEGLVAVARLQAFGESTEPQNILAVVTKQIRPIRQRYYGRVEEEIATGRRRDHPGGSVCWEPGDQCPAACRDCPNGGTR